MSLVSAPFWHAAGTGPHPSMRTIGGWVARSRSSKSGVRMSLDRYGRCRCGCCTLVLHFDGLTLECGLIQAHGSVGGKRSVLVPVYIMIQFGAWSTLVRNLATLSLQSSIVPH